MHQQPDIAALFERITDAFIALDCNWCYTYMNKKAGEIFSRNPKEMIGRHIWKEFPEDIDQTFYKACHRAMAEQQYIHVEEYDPPYDKWVENDIYPSPEGLSIFFRDITERKQAEEKIINNEKRFRALAENCTDGLNVIGSDGVVIDMNPSGKRILGYDSNEIVGKIRPDLIHPEDVVKVAKALTDVIGDRSDIQFLEYRHKMPDGSYKWLESSYNNLLDQPYLNAIILNYRDITERKKNEKELNGSEIRYRRLFESAKDGILILDAESGKIFDANPFLLNLIGYSHNEISGKELWELGTFKDIVASKEAFIQLQENEYIHYEDLPLKSKTGKVIDVEFVSNEYIADHKKVIQCNIRDITERKKTEAEIKSTNEQLRQLTVHLQNIREEERKRIGREIHDELGQQLTAIKMDIAWIDKKIPEESSIIKTKLKNVVTLLDGSNLSIRKILNELRSDILENHGIIDALKWQGRQFTANTGIPLVFSSSETVLNVEASIGTCLFRVFQEALTNITRYAEAKKVISSLNYSDDVIKLEIEDDGKGFDTVLSNEKITYGNLGMRERVASLNGKFELLSSPGNGTKIIITIPFKS